MITKHRTWRRARTASVALVAGASLLLAACGGGSDDGGSGNNAQADGNGLCGHSQSELDADPAYAAVLKAAAAEGTVDWSNAVSEDEVAVIVTAFNKAYPCLKVNFSRVSDDDSRATMLAEMKTGLFQVDVLDISGSVIPDFKEANLLLPVDWKTLFPKVDDQQIDPDGALISVGGSIKTVAFNTDFYKADDIPDTWAGFTEPAWKGKFEIDSKPKVLYQLVPSLGLDGVVDLATKIAANKPQMRRGESETMQLVNSGEVEVAVGMSFQNVSEAIASGAPVDYKLVQPVPFSLEQQAVINGAPHPNAGTILLGWLATDGNLYYDEVTNRGLPFESLGTPEAKMLTGMELSVCNVACSQAESDYSDKVLPALGVS